MRAFIFTLIYFGVNGQGVIYHDCDDGSLATIQNVNDNLAEVQNLINAQWGQWAIVKLADGGTISGAGYDWTINPNDARWGTLGARICYTASDHGDALRCASLFDGDIPNRALGTRVLIRDGGEEVNVVDSGLTQIRSATINPGCQLQLWDGLGYTGRYEVFSEAATSASAGEYELDGTWNWKVIGVKSFRCLCVDYACATAFDDDGYTGPSTVINNEAEVSNGGSSFSSVRVNPGCTFEVFENAAFGGISSTYPAALDQGVHAYEMGATNQIGFFNWNRAGISSYRCNCVSYPDVMTHGGSANGAPCHFPFTYNGHDESYNSCTTYEASGTVAPWCATTPTYDPSTAATTTPWGWCPVDDHADHDDCNCGWGQWSCENTGTCQHPNRCEVTVLPGEYPKSKCVPEPPECRCWGDPHCVSFDGKQNHVFGLGQFTIVHNEYNYLPKIDVRMHTYTTAKPVYIEWVCADFEVMRTSVPISICVDHTGAATIEHNHGAKQPLTATPTPIAGQYSFTQTGNSFQLTTWFGARVRFDTMHNGGGTELNCDVHIHLPAVYKTHTSGICGNYNDNEDDDHIGRRRRALATHELLSSVVIGEYEPFEFDCNHTTVDHICEDMFNEEWLDECRDLVDPSFDVATCSYDLCLDNSDQIKFNILNQYVRRCLAAQSADSTSMCNWVDNIALNPACGANEYFNACAYECHDERTCYEELNEIEECGPNLANRTARTTRHSKCVCEDGYFLEHGICVHRDDCDTSPGEWGEWHEWGSCSEPCGGIAHRVRLCNGPNPCEGMHQDMKECRISDDGTACDCSNPNFCTMGCPSEMTFGDAKQFCYDHYMELPTPRNDEENGWFTEVGPTWLDIYVNDLFKCNDMYGNWRQRQRGYLSESGDWDIVQGNEPRECFCVGQHHGHVNECDGWFGHRDVFGGGQWTAKQPSDKKYTKFTKNNYHERLGDISPGTRFKYKCKGDQPMGFICVRNEDGKHMMAHCTDDNGQCKTFLRHLVEPVDFNFEC